MGNTFLEVRGQDGGGSGPINQPVLKYQACSKGSKYFHSTPQRWGKASGPLCRAERAKHLMHNQSVAPSLCVSVVYCSPADPRAPTFLLSS